MKYKLVSLLLLLSSSLAQAGEVGLRFGGMINQPTLTINKLIELDYTSSLTKTFDYRLSTGYFNDNIGRFGTVFGGASLGVKVTQQNFFVSLFFGPSLVSYQDPHLSSVYQFHTELEVGLNDKSRGTSISIGYEHLSNAGLQAPNLGRDFLFLRVGF